MPNYRRAHVPGGSFFRALGTLLRRAKRRWPFTINAVVLLPDHLHVIWSLPPGDTDYSKRLGWIKKEFSKGWLAAGRSEQPVTNGMSRQGRRGVWQPRFWEHALESEDDFERHFDYVHYNPVKHRLARCPRDWPWSSFHRWVRAGVYPLNWGCASRQPLDFRDLEDSTGEPAASKA